ncbi:sensor histidine kinase [Kitasatospora sp. MAP12-44]|uniref:sensor histidine kinase n=2 Tax=unclassified Kitasatospora TaxID=2633591 RepID=UPI002474D7CE|nr:histidine kinase [Kitasatospora sp. MAP12-44]
MNLKAAGSLLIQDPHSLMQAMANAEQILSDMVNALHAGRVQVNEKYKLIAWDIGATRATAGVHPQESLEAASIFFRTALAALTDLVGPRPESLDAFTVAALTLEQSIALRVRESVSSYNGVLLNRVREAQIDERRRIARDLHDRIGHGISVSHHQLELYNIYRDTEPAKASEKVESAQQAIRESMHHLRAVTSGLHAQEPLKSLEDALLNYLGTVASEELPVRLRVNGDESWAPPEILDEAFLILREAARNTLRHSGASMLLINVDITPHELRASVEDDGCGFDPLGPPVSDGVGVASMLERAELLGGRVTITSRIGAGTRVDLWLRLTERFANESA